MYGIMVERLLLLLKESSCKDSGKIFDLNLLITHQLVALAISYKEAKKRTSLVSALKSYACCSGTDRHIRQAENWVRRRKDTNMTFSWEGQFHRHTILGEVAKRDPEIHRVKLGLARQSSDYGEIMP